MRRAGPIAATLLALGIGAAAQSGAVLVTEANIVDITTGTVAEGQSMLIEDGMIAAVGADL